MNLNFIVQGVHLNAKAVRRINKPVHSCAAATGDAAHNILSFALKRAARGGADDVNQCLPADNGPPVCCIHFRIQRASPSYCVLGEGRGRGLE